MKFKYYRRARLTLVGTLSFVGLLGCAAGLSGVASADNPVAPDAVQVKDQAIEASLTGAPGNPAEGRNIFADRKLGNCLACHSNSDLNEQLFHGGVGPGLDGVAGRWSESQLRSIVVNSKIMFTESTVMPGFYSLDVGVDVRKDLVGKTILTADQVEDVIAYLGTLK